MNRKKWRIGQKATLLMTILIVEGSLLGAMTGMVHYGGAKEGEELDRESGYRAAHEVALKLDSDFERTKEEGLAGSENEEDYAAQRKLVDVSGSDGQKVVALTFDDGPHEKYTVQLLDGLKERGVKATFFLMGQNIEGKEALVLRMKQEGHLIGNHSYQHIQLTKAGESTVCEAVERTGDIIEKITGERPQYLRPPYGDWNDNLECRLDMTTVFWSVDSLDWKLKNVDEIVSNVEKKIGNGDIVLMHDIFPTSVEAALRLVDRLTEKGYQFVTVEELLID